MRTLTDFRAPTLIVIVALCFFTLLATSVVSMSVISQVSGAQDAVESLRSVDNASADRVIDVLETTAAGTENILILTISSLCGFVLLVGTALLIRYKYAHDEKRRQDTALNTVRGVSDDVVRMLRRDVDATPGLRRTTANIQPDTHAGAAANALLDAIWAANEELSRSRSRLHEVETAKSVLEAHVTQLEDQLKHVQKSNQDDPADAEQSRLIADEVEAILVDFEERISEISSELLDPLSGELQSVLDQTEKDRAAISQRDEAARQSAKEVQSRLQAVTLAIEGIEEGITNVRSIAEKTNNLALNASIEASRAGEAGRGFSVVAGEVKALAERTKTSTADISERVDSATEVSRDALATAKEFEHSSDHGEDATSARGKIGIEPINARFREAMSSELKRARSRVAAACKAD